MDNNLNTTTTTSVPARKGHMHMHMNKNAIIVILAAMVFGLAFLHWGGSVFNRSVMPDTTTNVDNRDLGTPIQYGTPSDTSLSGSPESENMDTDMNGAPIYKDAGEPVRYEAGATIR